MEALIPKFTAAVNQWFNEFGDPRNDDLILDCFDLSELAPDLYLDLKGDGSANVYRCPEQGKVLQYGYATAIEAMIKSIYLDLWQDWDLAQKAELEAIESENYYDYPEHFYPY